MNPKKLILASDNAGKIAEVQEILEHYEILSMKQVGLSIDIEEDGSTFEENAIKKAVTIAKMTGRPCIADDSGLCIDFLNGFPGIRSKRFLGESATDKDRNEDILKQLSGIPKDLRTAHFVCCIAFSLPNKQNFSFQKSLDGFIATSRRGKNGFGFDEIFELKNGKTLAELTQKEKLEISSRKSALEELKKFLQHKGF